MSSLVKRNNFFDDFFGNIDTGFFVKPLHGDALPNPEKIKIDVTENENVYKVTAEIPGVSKENIHVSIDDNRLTLRAEIKQEDSSSMGDKSLRTERYYGEISRSFQLPASIDFSASNAKYKDGVLYLTLKKKNSHSGANKLKIE